LLIGCVQEQRATIESLREEIASLRARGNPWYVGDPCSDVTPIFGDPSIRNYDAKD